MSNATAAIEILNAQTDTNNGRWTWSTDFTANGDVYEMALVLPAGADVDAAVSTLVYALRTGVRLVEVTTDEFQVVHTDENMVIVAGAADWTKTYSDDTAHAWTSDETGRAQDILANGSPIRKTDRAGAGTKGTRAVEALVAGAEILFR